MSSHKSPLTIPQVLESKKIFEESLVHVRKDILKEGEHEPYPYYVLETNPYAVIILPIMSNGTLVLTEEYRHPTKTFVLGCPAGYINPNENPIDAAKRELLEETGYEAESYEVIGQAYPYTGFTGQKNYFVLAKGAVYSQEPQLEQSEIIRTKLITVESLTQLIAKGCELDSTVGTALFFFLLQGKK